MAKNQVVVRTPQDLERKYNLASLLGLSKNIEINKQGMQKIENELNNFIVSTVGDIQDLQEQIDGKVTTWYYSGEPTLNNEPAKTWNTEELKNEHLGDLYYDKATGRTYIFQYGDKYFWEEIENVDVTEALAIANAAKDTADSKRQVFVVEPKTPYDVGDLWISNQEVFICQASRKAGEFNSNDWINNLKYTDNTVAYAVREELNKFATTTTGNIENLQSQIDGNITTYYYSGVPTLSNSPVSEWSEYNTHVGDLYYDKDTGYAYRFYLDSETNGYGWAKITDSDVTEALNLSQQAQDTADGKRRVFIVQPIPPYDEGDLWLNNQELYVCQIAKTEGTYEENDFTIATKYTDDTQVNYVRDELTILEGTVTTIQASNDNLNIEFVKQQQIYDTLKDEVVSIEGKLDDMSFNFSTNGLSIGSSLDANNSLLDNTGIKVYNYNKLNAVFNNKGSGIDKLIVTGTAQIGYLKVMKTIENGEKFTDIFHLENLIEELEDLI
jgi:phage-related protein